MTCLDNLWSAHSVKSHGISDVWNVVISCVKEILKVALSTGRTVSGLNIYPQLHLLIFSQAEII